MGDSAKLPESGPSSYRFVEHREYLDGLFDALNLGGRVTLVSHDWGSALGFDWANRNRARVVGIAYMEAIVQPASWFFWPEEAQSIFKAMRSQVDEAIVLDKDVFVDRILPGAVLRNMSDDQMVVYKRPYTEAGESRRPILTWRREIPIDGHPSDVQQIVSDFAAWTADNEIPFLFVNAEPGSILRRQPGRFCRTWKNQAEVTVRGSHFVQEDSPDEIGDAIRQRCDSLA
jgi:haloalkane dehalogenase